MSSRAKRRDLPYLSCGQRGAAMERQIPIRTHENSMIPAPIFILGITRRSGTNFLWKLLERHPHVACIPTLAEDFALYHADLLLKYADETRGMWDAQWKFDANARNLMVKSLGDGLLSFLAAQSTGVEQGQRLLLKTPSVRNLGAVFDLVPGARVLILVRDGRDVVQSSARSFKHSRDEATRMWREGADTIIEFERANQANTGQYLVVRYERLVTDLDASLREIFVFLRLDASVFDFSAAQTLPVWGSSDVRTEGKELHWRPLAKSPSFEPIGRWRDWSAFRRQRFHWMAAHQMAALGYPLDASFVRSPAWWLVNVALDGLLAAGVAVRNRANLARRSWKK